MFPSGKPSTQESANVMFKDQYVFIRSDFPTFTAASDRLEDLRFSMIDSDTFRGWTLRERENVSQAIIIEFEVGNGNIIFTQDVTGAIRSGNGYDDKIMPRNGRALFILNAQGATIHDYH